jgi:DNA-binding winged helix-turn-helix (wHTH) protein/TolB-like protein/Tfp pilus assembly protein PilF
MSSLQTPPRWRFGPFECDPVGGDLFKAGHPVKLQDQPRQVLLALLEHPGEIVSREQLQQRLWTDDTFVDFDNGLNVSIRKIREALGDVAPTARYVETVRGQGYRFVAPVSVVTPAAPAPEPPTANPSRRLHPMALATVILLVLVAVGTVAWRSRDTDAPLQSLAVLPFGNLLQDETAQYLVDGLTESLTSGLATHLQVRVVSSQSAFRVGTAASGVVNAARQLQVDAVVTGTVARAGRGIVVAVRLVEANTDRVRWSGRFERAAIDHLTVSDDIVDAILVNVGGSIDRGSKVRNSRVVLPEARNAYLRGRFFWAKRGQANAVTATGYLTSAIQLQPDYAEAWAGLADVYAVHRAAPSAVIAPWPGDSDSAGVIAARRAIELDPTLGEAHAALGKILVNRRQWTEAEKELRLAVQLNPNYSTARQWLGTMYGRLRRCDEARLQVETGARLDPLTTVVNEAVGSVYMSCGEPGRAVEMLQDVLKMHPEATPTRGVLGRALLVAGRAEEALAVLEPGQQPGAEGFGTGWLLTAYARTGRIDQVKALTATIKSNYLQAVAAAAMGDRTQLFEHLDLAWSTDQSYLHGLLNEPAFAPFIGDPAFVEFARRSGFPVPIPPARFSH